VAREMTIRHRQVLPVEGFLILE